MIFAMRYSVFVTLLYSLSPFGVVADELPDATEGGEEGSPVDSASSTKDAESIESVNTAKSGAADSSSAAPDSSAIEADPGVADRSVDEPRALETGVEAPRPIKKKQADPPEASTDPADAGVDKKKKKKKVEVRTRIHVRWEMEERAADGELENRFLIRRARLKLIWEPEKWITAKLQVGGFQDLEFGMSLLKDAYIHLSPSRYVEVRVGQFKKPFSRLELRSSGKLRVAERGDGNSFIIEDLLHGGRDIGLQLSGRIVKSIKLDYEAGVFNGTGPNLTELGNAKDVTVRLKTQPVEWFEVGSNGSFKFFDDDAHKARDEKFTWAAGVDTVFRFFGVRLHLEGLMARDHLYLANYPLVDPPLTEMPLTLNGLAIISYRHKFDTSWRVAVEPVFKVEYLDPNLDFIDDQILLYTPGFNTYLGKVLRLMLNAEFRRGGRNHLASFRDRETLMLQLCLDI